MAVNVGHLDLCGVPYLIQSTYRTLQHEHDCLHSDEKTENQKM